MEISEEELERIKKKLIESDKKNREINEIHDRIKKLYKTSKLPYIKPLWHTDIADIDLAIQNHKLDSYLLEDGYTIIEYFGESVPLVSEQSVPLKRSESVVQN